ncbi:MAG TPA: glutathione S-transferase family protein [Croceicoccus sp.]|nr:glutathione S-transferase family protein [Croceicoccus sp.]
MITIHHLGKSRSDRAVWLMEELGAPYELKLYERMDNLSAPQEYKTLHPLGSSPVIADGDRIIAESGAVIEYLATTQGGGALAVAAGDPDYADYLFWFHFAESTVMPEITREIMAEAFALDYDHPSRQFARQRAAQYLRHTDARLARSPWFAGDRFTAADIMMAFPFTTTRLFTPVDIDPYPNIADFVKRVEQRPAYRRCREVTGEV